MNTYHVNLWKAAYQSITELTDTLWMWAGVSQHFLMAAVCRLYYNNIIHPVYQHACWKLWGTKYPKAELDVYFWLALILSRGREGIAADGPQVLSSLALALSLLSVNFDAFKKMTYYLCCILMCWSGGSMRIMPFLRMKAELMLIFLSTSVSFFSQSLGT